MLELPLAGSGDSIRERTRCWPFCAFRGRAVAWIAVGSIAASSIVSLLVAVSYLLAPPATNSYTQVLWRWFDVGGLRPDIALYLDPLSLIMMVVVAFVSFLIHLYSTEFMIERRGIWAVLCLHESVRRLHADTGPRGQPASALSGMGRCGSVQLSAHRFLVSGPGKWPCRPQSIHRDPCRRYRFCDRPLSSLS